MAWFRADGMLDTACNDAAASWRKKRLLLKCAAAAAWGGKGGGMGRHCCGSGEILMGLLRGAGTAAAVEEYRKDSCWGGYCCGSGRY